MFGKSKKIAALEQQVASLTESNRDLQRKLPDGVAGMAGLSIAEYFNQWEQTGHDPYTQIPVLDVDAIERSAVTHAINKAAMQLVGELPAQELIEYTHKLNPELIELQLKRIQPEQLAEAIAKGLPAHQIAAWIATNGEPEQFATMLDSYASQKSGLDITKELLKDNGIIELNCLPIGTELELFFMDATVSQHQLRLTNSNYRYFVRPKSEKRQHYFYRQVRIIVTRSENDETYLRIDEFLTNGQTPLNAPLKQVPTTVQDTKHVLAPDTLAFDHEFSVIQNIHGQIKETKIGKLVQVGVPPTDNK